MQLLNKFDMWEKVVFVMGWGLGVVQTILNTAIVLSVVSVVSPALIFVLLITRPEKLTLWYEKLLWVSFISYTYVGSELIVNYHLSELGLSYILVAIICSLLLIDKDRVHKHKDNQGESDNP